MSGIIYTYHRPFCIQQVVPVKLDDYIRKLNEGIYTDRSRISIRYRLNHFVVKCVNHCILVCRHLQVIQIVFYLHA